MKKTLLLGLAAVASLGVAAQSQYTFMDLEALIASTGLPWDGSADVPAGTVLVEDEYGTKMTVMFDEPAKKFNPSRSPYSYVAVGGGELNQITDGITGNNNPKGQTMNDLPTSGMVYQITTTQTGYFTVLGKLNTNKNYWLFEGSSFAAYRLGDCNLSKVDEGVTVEYTMPVDEYDTLDLNSPEIGKYFNTNDDGVPTGPKVPWQVVNPEGEDMGEGSGFIQFVSYASEEYPAVFTIFAQGSKLGTNGFIFTPAAEPTFANAPEVSFGGVEKLDADGNVIPAPAVVTFAGAQSGIENVTVDNVVADDAMYNVLGQRVNESYKGLVIKGGKKFINK